MGETAQTLEAPFGGKKLFTVEIETEVVVLASDESEAEEIAKEQAGCGGNVDWNDADYTVQESDGWIPPDWTNAIPFGMGTTKQRTCEQILAAWKEYEAAQPPTAAELEALGQQRLL